MTTTPTAPATVFEALDATSSRVPEWPFVQVLAETAKVYGIEAGEITYGTMRADAVRRANAYRVAGFGAGQRVGILLENRPSFFQHWFALNAIGVSVVPINPDLRAAELEYLVAHSEMVAAIVLPSRQDDIRRAAAAGNRKVAVFGPDDAISSIGPARTDTPKLDRDTECALLYTSGTTGRPKGCVLTNTYFLNSGDWYLTVGGLIQLGFGQERMLTPLPLFHMNAMATSTMTMVMSGGCLIVLDRFHPKTWWESVENSRATIVHYLGVMPPMLMGAPASAVDKKHSVKFGFGAGIDRRLHAPFEERFGFPLIEAWAMTETGGGVVISDNHEPRHTGKSCFGKPGAESDVRVVDDAGKNVGPEENGELLVRRAGSDPKHGFFREYLKDPQATAEAWEGGWFHTGDVVRRDADGYFYFVDRKKNVIRRSGENIAAVEVESVLMQHPRIAAVGVAAAPDEVRGDEVFACIVARAIDPPMTPDELAADIMKFCAERLAYYKAPGYISFQQSLPVTATQKIQRGTLKTLVGDLLKAADTIDTRHLKKRTG